MNWNYYVLPGFVARMEDVYYAKSGNPKVEIQGTSGMWEEPEEMHEMQRMISREGTLVDEKTAAQAFIRFNKRT